MSNNYNQLKVGSVISYIQMTLQVIIGLVYTPIMLRLLGQSEYGLYNTVASTISMLSILNLGFSSGYIRYFAQYKEEKDEDAIAKLNGMFLIIFAIIGFIALVCGTYLSFNLHLVFDKGLTLFEYKTARVLMFLLTANLAISFPMSVFQTIISANERFIVLKGLAAIRTVLSPLITLPLLLIGYGSIAMACVSVGLAIVVDFCYLFYVKNCLHNRFVFRGIEFGLLKSLFIYVSFIALNLIIDQINWNIDKILLGRFRGTVSVAVYSVGYVLYNYYMILSVSVSDVFTPRIHRLCNSSKNQLNHLNAELTELFIKVGRVQFIILALVASVLCFFGKIFIKFWAGKGYTNSYYIALLLVIPASIALIQNLGIEIQRAENKHQFRSIVYAIMAVVNLILSIFLCQLYGAIGAAIGTAVSLIIANGIIMNIYYHKKCGINILLFWKNVLQQSVGLVIPVTVGVLLNLLINFNSFTKLFFAVVLYTVVYSASMWILGMNQFEKELLLRPLKKIFKFAE